MRLHSGRFLIALVGAVSVTGAQPAARQATASSPMDLVTPAGTLSGTLVMPGTSGRVPVALIVAGSGPTDRDADATTLSGANDAYRMLADALAAQGIASLRYDTRGIGASAAAAGPETDGRVGRPIHDAALWIAKLRNDFRFTTITVIGHGEGSLIGMLAARAGRADGFVSIAGPGRRSANVVDDPGAEFARLTVPRLIVQGTTDTQVPVGDAHALKAAAPAAELRLIEGMNHVMRTVTNPGRQPVSSVDPGLPLAADLAPAVVGFVRALEAPGVPQPRRPTVERRSLRDVTRAEIDGVRIAVEYGRPSKRGRLIWGALVPFGRWWMPGADEASTLTTSAPMRFGDLPVPAGDHTIYTVPADDRFLLIINGQTWQFHTVYDPGRDLGRVPLTRTMRTGEPVEQLTFAITPRPGGGGTFALIWDDRQYAVDVTAERR
jgi:pimeloyl-ACP methyl ester carboxylesterase